MNILKSTLGWAGLFLILQSSTFAAVYEERFVAAPGIFPANHGSTLQELPDGKILSCWYAGTAEKAKDVQIYCSNLDPSQGTWGQPRVAVASGERASWTLFKNRTLGNPVLHLDRDGTLWLFYSAVTIFDGWSGSHVDYKTSKDFGQTWSGSKRMIWFFGNLTKNKAITLADGRVMLPLYHELFGRKGYSCILELADGKIEDRSCKRIPKYDHLQPTLIPGSSADQVFAYLRVGKDRRFIHRSEYSVSKNKWSTPIATNLPNPDAGVDALIAADGRILMTYNADHQKRAPLSIGYSTDALNFTKIWDFETEDDTSYPVIIRASNGLYHVTYTYRFRSAIKHVTFDETWLQEKISGAAPTTPTVAPELSPNFEEEPEEDLPEL